MLDFCRFIAKCERFIYFPKSVNYPEVYSYDHFGSIHFEPNKLFETVLVTVVKFIFCN